MSVPDITPAEPLLHLAGSLLCVLRFDFNADHSEIELFNDFFLYSEDLRVDYVEGYDKFIMECPTSILEGSSRNSLTTIKLVAFFLT